MSSLAIRGSASPMLALLLDTVTTSGVEQQLVGQDYIIRSLEHYWVSVLTHFIDDRFVADVQGIRVDPDKPGTYLAALIKLIQDNLIPADFIEDHPATHHLGGKLIALLESRVATLYGAEITPWLRTGYDAWFAQFGSVVDTLVSPDLGHLRSAWFGGAAIERSYYTDSIEEICCYPSYSAACQGYIRQLNAVKQHGRFGMSLIGQIPRFTGLSNDSEVVVSPLADLLCRVIVYISQPDTLRQVLVHGLAQFISRSVRIRGRTGRDRRRVGYSKTISHQENEGLTSWLKETIPGERAYGRAHITVKIGNADAEHLEKWLVQRLDSERRVTIVRHPASMSG